MTEPRRDWPAGLPLGPEAPAFAPPDPAALLHRGRHMRRMHAVVATASVVALMAVGSAVAVGASSHRADRLNVVTPAVSPTPTPHGSPAALPPATHDSVTVLGDGSQASGSTAVVVPPTNVLPTPMSSTVVPTAPAPSTASPFRRTRVTDPAATSCAYQPESAPSGWCVDYPGPYSAPAGVPLDLSVEVCRIKGLGTGTLRFGTAQEADVGIWGTTRAQSWQWSHGRDFAATRHSLTVPAGECLRWTTRWTTRANNGALLPRGSYSIQIYVASPDVDLPNTVTGTSSSFDLT